MTHSKCYLCHRSLDKSNSSKEHIIPNALGGKLTARILCHDCNNRMGSSYDAQLAKALEFFAYKVNHPRSYGKVQAINVKLNGHPVKALPGGGFKTIHPIEDSDSNHIRLRAFGDNIEEIINKVLLNLKRKNKIDQNQYQKLKQEIPKQIKIVRHPIVEREFQFNNIWFGLLKIAINFAVYKDISDSEIEDAINVLTSNDELKTVPYVNFYYSDETFPRIEGSICHRIHLIGDANIKCLYCFISLYDVLQSIVLLSSRYKGKNFDSSYCYDVWNEKEIFAKCPQPLTLKELNAAFESKGPSENWKDAFEQFINFFVISKNFSVSEISANILTHLEEYVKTLAMSEKSQIHMEEFKNYLTQYLCKNKNTIFQHHLFKDKDIKTFVDKIADYSYERYMLYIVLGKLFRIYVQTQINEHRLTISSNIFWKEFQSLIDICLDKSEPKHTHIIELLNNEEFRYQIFTIWIENLKIFKVKFPALWERFEKV